MILKYHTLYEEKTKKTIFKTFIGAFPGANIHVTMCLFLAQEIGVAKMTK